MKISKIIIRKAFKDNPPHKEKLNDKEQYLLKTGYYEQPIVIDENNILIDGYTTYLLSHFYDIKPQGFKKIGKIKYPLELEFEWER